MASKTVEDRSRYVDMWAVPGWHPTNIELLQKLKTADTNHFNTNMDVVGTVSEMNPDSQKWEKTHMIGVRTDVWKLSKKEIASSIKSLKDKRKAELKKQIKRSGRLNEKQADVLEQRVAEDAAMQMTSSDIELRRLVLKLFKTTSQRVRWCGTIEEVTATEIHNSIGSRKPLLTMAVMLPRTNYVTYIQQNHKTFRVPSTFSFCYYDNRRMWNLCLKRRWLSLGVDYSVEADGEAIGELDGKFIGLGTDSYIDLQSHPLTNDTEFCDLMTLFTSSIGYHRAMRRCIQQRVKAALSGQSHLVIVDDDELRLRNNGRSAA
jgi:hypothetical protein